MRKSLVLALVLVFAIAGATFAATPSIGGEFSFSAEHNDAKTFFGEYNLSKELELTIRFAEEQDAWDASIAVKALSEKPGLGRYIVNLNDDAFKATVWGNYGNGNIGHLGDALGFLRVSGQNGGDAPKLRVTTNLGGVDVATQFEGNSIYATGSMGLDEFTLGATVKHTKGDNDFAVFGGADLGIVGVDAAYAVNSEDSDNTAMGVKASADVTEQLSLSALYQDVAAKYDGTSKYSLGATFTEGLLKASVDHEKNTDDQVSTNTITVTYRGSEDNVAFGDLFKGGDYYKNVAPAFEASYATNDGDDAVASTITLKATAPIVPEQLWINAELKMESGDKTFTRDTGHGALPEPDEDDNSIVQSVESATSITLNAYAPMGEKLVFKPHVSSVSYSNVSFQEVDENGIDVATGYSGSGNASKLTVKLDADYKLAEDATITFGIGQTSYSGSGDFQNADPERFSSIGFKVEF